MNEFLKSLIQKFSGQNLTDTRGSGKISRNHEVLGTPIREAEVQSVNKKALVSQSSFDSNSPLSGHRTYLGGMLANIKLLVNTLWTGGESNPRSRNDKSISPTRARPTNSLYQKPVADSLACPYCLSKNFQWRGFRQKKLEKIQLYLCMVCGKTFTPQITKGKHYPLAIMLDALSVYNLGYSLEETCGIVNQRMATKKSASADLVYLTDSLNGWIDTLSVNLQQSSNFVKSQDIMDVDLPEKDNLPYLRLREFAHHEYENIFTNERECANEITNIEFFSQIGTNARI